MDSDLFHVDSVIQLLNNWVQVYKRLGILKYTKEEGKLSFRSVKGHKRANGRILGCEKDNLHLQTLGMQCSCLV